MVFRRLLRVGFSPLSGAVLMLYLFLMSFLQSGFRPISITPVQSKVYERLVSCRLCAFLETECVFPRHQYANRKGLRTYDALLDIV